MITEIKNKDQKHDQPVNAATKIPRDHKKQSSMNAAAKKIAYQITITFL
jgi:hypothetical protein